MNICINIILNMPEAQREGSSLDRYVCIDCRTESERALVMTELSSHGIVCSKVNRTSPDCQSLADDRFLAYFSTETHLRQIRKTLDKYRLIHNEVLFLSPKQKSFLRLD